MRCPVGLDEVFVLWSAARAEANLAYDAWCECPGPMRTPSTAPPRTAPTRPRPSWPNVTAGALILA